MLVRLATEEEKKSIDKLTFAEWGAGLTIEQWFEREKKLRAHEWCESSMSTWVLVDGVKILSSCETFRMQSAFKHKKGHSYGFASVYTEKELRGKGYASEMIKKVIETITADDSLAQAFILYSEVGTTIYEKLGFQACESKEIIIKKSDVSIGELNGVELYDREKAREMVSDVLMGDCVFFIRPLKSQIDWHFERQKIYAHLLGKQDCKIAAASTGASHFIWYIDFKSNCLRALISDFANGEEAKTLIRTAFKECESLNINEMRFYQSDIYTDWNELGLAHKTVERSDAIAMLRPNIKELKASDWCVITRALWV